MSQPSVASGSPREAIETRRGNRLWGKIKRLKGEAPDIDSAGTADMLKWAAGGFALLTAVLTFFGIKEGLLNRVVHEHQVGAMGVLLLIGAGTLLALTAPVLKTEKLVHLFWVLAAVMAVIVVTDALSPDITPIRDNAFFRLNNWPAWCLGAAILLAALLLEWRLPWPITFAVLAVVAVSAGLYAAAKISVNDKARSGQASISATMVGTQTGDELKVEAKGSDIYDPIRLVVRDKSDATARVLASAVLVPDQSGSVANSVSVRLPAEITDVAVLTCRMVEQAGDNTAAAARNPSTRADGTCTDLAEQISVSIPHQPARVSASFAQEDKESVTYTVTGHGLAADSLVKVSIGSLPAAAKSESTVRPGADGTFTLTGKVTPTKGQTWTVNAARCGPTGTDCQPSESLATFTTE